MSSAGGDITVVWDNNLGVGDWQIEPDGGDLLTGNDLATAVLVSLFTDKRASDDWNPTDGTQDRRGWWADYYEDRPFGSLLWTLDRAKKTQATLGLARQYAIDALRWLLDDGVAKTVEVDARWVTSTMIGMLIVITQPDGAVRRFAYGWAWSGIQPLAGPFPVGMLERSQLQAVR